MAGLLACCGLGILVAELHKTITLVVDGKTQEVDTWAWKVGQVLQAASIFPGPYDRLTPSIGDFLTDGDWVTLDRASTIQVVADGKLFDFYAVHPIPAYLIRNAGIQLYPGDELVSAGAPLDKDVPMQGPAQTYVWQLRRAVTFQLVDGVKRYHLVSTAATVGQAVWQAGIRLSSADNIIPGTESPLTPAMTIEIQRARPLTILTAQGEFSIVSAGRTVGAILQDSGMSIQGLDYTIPAENEPVPADGKIRLVRVYEEILIEQTPVPFESSFQPVDDLEIDHQTILEAGQYGLQAVRVRIRYEDGQEVSRQSEDQWLALMPVTRLVGYGTQIVMRTIQTSDGTVEYWRALEVYATSYKPSDTGKWAHDYHRYPAIAIRGFHSSVLYHRDFRLNRSGRIRTCR